MKKLKSIKVLFYAVLFAALIIMTGCSDAEQTADPGIADGTYVATFTTDNPMFHVNDAHQDRGILTVADGKMTIHVSLQSKKIVNLYPDTVTYSDGYKDEVYGFDVPVPALDEEFDVALLGTKGKWYDHKVIVSDPVEGDDISAVTGDSTEAEAATASELGLSEGEHTVDVSLDGGTGRASVDSPAVIRINGDECIAVITWSSPHYDYMIVDGKKYEPVNTEGNSVFEIPVPYFDKAVNVIADTTAMSEPHKIEYTLTFDSASIK